MEHRITGTPGTIGAHAPSDSLALTAADTTSKNPWPVSLLAQKMRTYIERMSSVWIEGQIIELSHRANATYLTLRDITEDMSVPIQLWSAVRDRLDTPLEEGARVVVCAKPSYWLAKGRLSLNATDVRAVGLGEMLARLEQRRRMLAAEGLFDPAHKRPLPFLPQCIGLITGHDSDALKDVIRNARHRWPAVNFEVRSAATQGTQSVKQVRAALGELDELASVDVIIIARGGGSLEDLLPFSDEELVRAVYEATTPVVSAIGHEADKPILDDVADVRASTPTDAAKLTVPDVAEEQMGVLQARATLNGALDRLIATELRSLQDVRNRPVLAQPQTIVTTRAIDITDQRARAWQAQRVIVDRAHNDIEHLRTQLRSLSPLNTLARGYAIVLNAQGQALRDSNHASAGEALTVKLQHGSLDVSVTHTHHDPHQQPLRKDAE